MKKGTLFLVFLAFVGVLTALTSSGHAEITGHIQGHLSRPGFPDPRMSPESPSSLNYAAFAVIIALAGTAAVWVYRTEARRPREVDMQLRPGEPASRATRWRRSR